MKITEVDAETGEQITRDMTADEIAAMPAPEPAPDARASMSAVRSSFIAAAANAGWITADEAVTWATSALPSSVAAAVATLPQAARMGATLRLLADPELARLDPAIVAWASALNKSATATDALFGA